MAFNLTPTLFIPIAFIVFNVSAAINCGSSFCAFSAHSLLMAKSYRLCYSDD